MLVSKIDKAITLLKSNLTSLKYKYYYPVLERIYHQQYVKEANEVFEKNQLAKQKKEVKIPIFVNEKYNKVFQDFCKSEITRFGFEKNKTSLCLVLGPNGIGKTTFIRSNLAKLMAQKKKTIQIENADWYNIQTFNCGSFGIMNFDAFINNFENLLINSIHKQFTKITAQPSQFLSQTSSNSDQPQFDSVRIIKDILYYNYSSEFLNLYARDMIQSLLNNEEITLEIPDELKPTLSEIFHVKMLEECVDFSEVYQDVVEVISSAFQGDTTKGALHLSVALLARIEYENRPPKMKDTYYRDGQIVNTYLFDLLNYLEGYHPLNVTQTQFAQNVIVLENFDNLFHGYQHDIRFLDFQDHLLLRLYSQHRERDHFPLVIETANSRFFQKELYDMMHTNLNTYGAIELYGIPEEQLAMQYNSIFSLRQINLLKKLIGANTNTWTKLLENIILSQQRVTQGSKKADKVQDRKQIASFSDILDLKTEFFEREYVTFKSKIQSIYLDNTLSQLVDGVDVQDRDFKSNKEQKDPALNESIIKFYLIDTFETLIYNYGTLQLSSQYAQYRILENHVVQALLSANIFYLRYYYSYMTFDKYVYNSFAKRYVNELKSNMSIKEKFEFYSWRRRNGIEKNALFVQNVEGLKLEKQPENTRDMQDFKLTPEHFQFKGIDFDFDVPTTLETIAKTITKK